MFKNQGGQKAALYAKSTLTGLGVTGDSGNITGRVAIDGTGYTYTDGSTITEVGGGFYYVDLSTAETNGDMIIVTGETTTANVLIDPTVIYTGQDANVTEVSGQAVSLDGTVDANMTALNGSTTAAGRLEGLALSARVGTASGAGLTSSIAGSDLTGLGDDAINNCFIVFTSGNAANEPRQVLDYSSTSGGMTFSPMTTAPTSGDTFTITGYVITS